VVEVRENASNGRFNIIVAIVNHSTKSEVDYYDIEIITF
jgi:hypothetical protein